MFLDLFFNISFFLNRYFKIRLLALFFLNLINTLLDIISISAVPAIIIFFLKKNEVSVEINYISELLNYFLHFTENIPFSIIFLLVLSFFLLKTILNIIYFYNYTKYGFDLEIKISKELVRRKLGDDYLDYTKNTYSSFLNLMTTIITEFIQNNFMISFQIFINIVTISVFTIFLALINPITTFSIIVISFIIFFIYYFLTKKRFIFFGKYKLILVEKTLAQIKDIFYSFKEIKLYGKEKFFIDKFINVKKAWAINKIKFQIISNLPKLLLEFFLILVIGLIFFFSRNMNLQIETILVNTTIFLIAAQRLFPKVIVIVRNFSKINYSKKAQKILIKELEKNIFENKDNIEIQFKSNILLNNISFDYETKNTIIENLNLKIKKNSFIGIKGESGRGKTTLTNIIMGLIKPTKGEIIIDNYINIHNGIHSYRRLIAYVPQKIYILNDTIKNNLFLEDYNKKSIDDDEILKILNLVRLNSFKESTGTDILNSIISDTTFKASEGEIQRFGIARALLQKKEIIILDEITSSLDEKNEANILNILKSLKNNATIIMISHKSSSLKLCDELYTLENKNLIKSNL